jgi:4'-phosphopantetheinyl transferase
MVQSYICRCGDISAIFEAQAPSFSSADQQTSLWFIKTADWQPYLRQLYNLLSEEEQTKAGKFHFEKDHQAYVIAHGLLRMILADYTGISPNKLLFSKSPTGKPFVSTLSACCYFSLSHTGGVALVAVNKSTEVGTDIEVINQDFTWTEVALNYFTPHELKQLTDNQSASLLLFYTYWTRKEAFLKAIGAGISDVMKSVEISGIVNEFTLRDTNQQARQSDWNIYSFRLQEQYIGSVACSPNSSLIKFYEATHIYLKA